MIRFVSWPMSAGIVPVILLLLRYLRRRGAVARRAGRRGRGGNSQRPRRRGIVGLAEDHNVDLVLGLAVAVVAVVLAD